MPIDEYRRANRANWDDRVPIHAASQDYDVVDHRSGLRALTGPRRPSTPGGSR